MPLLAIAKMTLREASRRRVVLAVAILSIIVVGLTTWGFAKLHAMSVTEGHPPPAQAPAAYAILVVLLAEMFSFVLAVGCAFLAAPAIAGDVDSGVALVVLPRPIRRSDLVLGKWLGLTALLTTYVIGMGGLELIAVRLVTGYSPPHPISALAYIALLSTALLTLALCLSTRVAAVTAGIIALVVFGIARVAEVTSTLAAIYHDDGLVHACTVVSLLVPTGELLRGAVFSLEPTLIAAASGTVAGANPITVPSPPTLAFMIWTAAWLLGVLTIAIWSFRHRDV